MLILLTVLTVGGTVIAVKLATSASEAQQAGAAPKGDILAMSKSALLGYFVRTTTGGTGVRLGNLPTPDSLGDGSYNGSSDGDRCLSNTTTGLPSVTGDNANKRCLGKIPWRDLEIDLGSVDANDPLGRVPWLAISANLSFWDTCLAKINSDILNWSYSVYACPAAAGALPHPWLTVRNETGAIISDRVAAVLILPGGPLATETRTQSRTPASPGNPGDYLDSIRLPLGCSACTITYDNAGMNHEFIAIPPGMRYPSTAEDVSKRDQPIPFNDRLIYITIDELVPILEKRVLGEMASALRDVVTKKGAGYPWAADFVAPSSYADFLSKPPRLAGLFPFMVDPQTPSPPDPYPGMVSGFSWNVTGVSAPAKNCVRVQTTPTTRWMNVRENMHTNIMSESASGTTSTCVWKGGKSVDCSQPLYTKNINKTFTRFTSSARCTAGTPVADTASYSVARSIQILPSDIDLSCNTAPTVTYIAATSSQPQLWSWQCTSVTGTSRMMVSMTDVVSYPISPFSSSYTISITSASSTTTMSNLRYQPQMPYWFYDNEWYKTAYYALSPSVAPAVGSTDCGAATTLTVGGSSVATALVLQAGARLPVLPATPTQTRPSASLANYAEGINATSPGNCQFESVGKPVNSTYNDQLLVVAP